MRSKYSVKFLVQLIFFLLFNNERLCKLFWEHLIWFRIFSTIVTCETLSVFRSQTFKGLWWERIKKSIYIVLIFQTNRFSVILFSSQSWSTRLYAQITFSILILTNWQKKKKEKKIKIGFVFLFSPKNCCQNCILLVHSHQNEANYCHFETYLCKYFSFVYCFLASADYDFFSHSQCISLKPFRHNKAKYCDCDTASLQNSNINKIIIAAKQWGKVRYSFFMHGVTNS